MLIFLQFITSHIPEVDLMIAIQNLIETPIAQQLVSFSNFRRLSFVWKSVKLHNLSMCTFAFLKLLVLHLQQRIMIFLFLILEMLRDNFLQENVYYKTGIFFFKVEVCSLSSVTSLKLVFIGNTET